MSRTPSSILSFPNAMPGADSADFIVQKGVSYIGRKGTDGPAVWEVICDAFGVDSLDEGIGNLADMFRRFLTVWFYNLPRNPPGVQGAAFLNGNFVNVDTDGTLPVADSIADIPPFLQTLFRGVIENYIASLPEGPLADAISKNGNFINVD